MESKNSKRIIIIVVIAIVLIAVIALVFFFNSPKNALRYDELRDQIEDGQVEEIRINNDIAQIKLVGDKNFTKQCFIRDTIFINAIK